MHWLDDILDRLAGLGPCGYHREGAAATEPTAWSAMALAAHARASDAGAAIEWLAANQADDGSLGPAGGETSPGWPTSVAILAAIRVQAADAEGAAKALDTNRAVDWLTADAGKPLENSQSMGHDTMLVGWPWVTGTHSWLEPTAFAVLALRAAGRGGHARAREGVRVIVDRLLPRGGCNYGNTFVLGQELRPHVQPTGIAMTALAGEPLTDPRIARSLGYLEGALSERTTTLSLCHGLIGLAAHGIVPNQSPDWLAAAARRTLAGDAAPLKLALLGLAAASVEEPDAATRGRGDAEKQL